MKAGGKRPPAGLCEGPDPGESCGDGTNAKASLPPGGTPARGRPGDTDHRIALAIGLRNQGGDDILAVKLDRERPDEVAGEARLELAIAVLETGALAANPTSNWRSDFGILSAKAESLQGAMRRKRV